MKILAFTLVPFSHAEAMSVIGHLPNSMFVDNNEVWSDRSKNTEALPHVSGLLSNLKPTKLNAQICRSNNY